jgi:hypothetical protein
MSSLALPESSIHEAAEAMRRDKGRLLNLCSEITEMVAAGQETIARSRALLVEADRIFAERRPLQASR